MLCINCKKDTPNSDIYCHHCGVKLDMTFDEVTEKMESEIDSERAEETEVFFRWILLLVIFFFVAGWLFRKVWENPPVPDNSPSFSSTLISPPTWIKADLPLIISDDSLVIRAEEKADTMERTPPVREEEPPKEDQSANVEKTKNIKKVKLISRGKRISAADHLVAGKYTLFEFYADW